VTKSAALLARNTAMPAKSSGSPQRPAGVRASTRFVQAGDVPARSPRELGVDQPGRIAFTWMLSFAQQLRATW